MVAARRRDVGFLHFCPPMQRGAKEVPFFLLPFWLGQAKDYWTPAFSSAGDSIDVRRKDAATRTDFLSDTNTKCQIREDLTRSLPFSVRPLVHSSSLFPVIAPCCYVAP